MNCRGDILLPGRTGRPAAALETSPNNKQERAASGGFSRLFAAAEILDVDLMHDESAEEVMTIRLGEALVKDDWGLLIGLAWAIPAGLVVWVVAVFLL